MFGNKTRDDRPAMPPATGGNGRRGMFSVIGADVVIAGNINASAELHVEGRIEGDVDCAALIQGAESHIVGGVTAESARIAGRSSRVLFPNISFTPPAAVRAARSSYQRTGFRAARRKAEFDAIRRDYHSHEGQSVAALRSMPL